MFTEYLLTHNGKYTVVTASVKESEAVYLVTHKKNSAVHNIHSIGVYDNGAMDCRCSVKMRHPCRHMFSVSEACHFKVVLGTMNTRFYTNQEGTDMMQGNLKKLAHTVVLVKSKQDIW